MEWQTTPYTAVVVLATLLLSGFLVYVLRLRSTPGSDETLDHIAVLLGVGVGWLLVYTVRLSATSLPVKSALSRVELALVLALPLVWLGYVMQYTRHGTRRDRRVVLGALGAFAALLALVAAVGPGDLVYSAHSLVDHGDYVVHEVEGGPGFWLAMAYVYGVLVAASVLLGNVVVNSVGLIRWQSGLMLFFSLFPGAMGLVQFAGVNPVPGLNVAVLSVLVTIVIAAVSATRFGWLRITPVPFTTLFEAVPDPTFVVDGHGRVTALNGAGAEFFGVPKRAVVGDALDDHAPEFDAHLPDDVTRLPDGGERRELAVTREDDESVYDVHVVPVGDPGGGEMLVVCRDVTDRAAAQRSLRAERERLDEFASVVSHDIRNPLTVARGRLELAAETGDLSHVDEAQEALDRMDDLVTDLLELARQGEDIGETDRVSLADTVAAAWNVVDTGDATLTHDGVEGLSLEADESRLCELLENLFRNAAEHGGDEVTVGELPGGGFYVADDGPGVPPDQRDAVFSGGNGIGLAVVRRIATAHGWEVGLTESESGGARFEVRT